MGEEKRAIRLPNLLPKKVRVVIMYPDREIELFGKLSGDGNQIKTRLGTFVVPSDYKPKITWCHKRTYLTYYFDHNGNAVNVKLDGKVEAQAPDPSFMRALVDKGLIAKIFRLGLDLSSMLTGIFLGAFIIIIIIFVMLPIMGIPVLIGKQPIEVVLSNQSVTGLPPVGNFTVGG